MKNILIISSSPRKKGNSQLLCEQFKKGAEEKGHQVKIVRIMEQNIGFCRACDGCMRNGGTCVLQDDMAEILKMFQKADVLVLATPVYFYGISAQLKAIVDRLHTPMRNEFQIKKLALLLVGAASLPNLFDAIKLQYQLVLEFFHLEDAGMILVRGVKDKGDIKGNEALREAYKLGLSIE